MTITQLRAQVGQSITGDPSFDGSIPAYAALSPNQQIDITNGMKAYIRAHPSEFGTVQNQVANTPDIQHTEDYTVGQQISDFTDEFGNQAMRVGESIASVGNGVLNTLNLAKYGIPIVGVIIVAIYLYGTYKKQIK